MPATRRDPRTRAFLKTTSPHAALASSKIILDMFIGFRASADRVGMLWCRQAMQKGMRVAPDDETRAIFQRAERVILADPAYPIRMHSRQRRGGRRRRRK